MSHIYNMKEHFIDNHSELCKQLDSKHGFGYCELNPERFLFFLGTKFILITYYDCIAYVSEGKYGFKEKLIKKVIDDNKIFEYYEVNRSVDLERDLKNFRIRHKALKKYIEQVNFIYRDMVGKKYAITTRIKYLDSICNQDEIKNNYEAAKIFLTENNYDWLLESLDELYYANRLYHNNSAVNYKTIAGLVKEIKQLR